MTRSKIFVDSKDAKKACKLQRLKYALRSWNLHRDEIVKSLVSSETMKMLAFSRN